MTTPVERYRAQQAEQAAAAAHIGRHRVADTFEPDPIEPEPPAPIPVGVAPDTATDNPVSAYPENLFPTGAAVTVAYGSVDNMFCTVGNLLRLVGYLTGEVPSIEGQQACDEQQADPSADPPVPYIAAKVHVPSLADEIERCRVHVAAQLPVAWQGMTLPAPDADDATRLAWLDAVQGFAGPTIRLERLPADA